MNPGAYATKRSKPFCWKRLLRAPVKSSAPPIRAVRTAAQGVKGYYPSFDITPPHLVSGVVTDTGIYAPYDLQRYFASGDGEFGQKGLCL